MTRKSQVSLWSITEQIYGHKIYNWTPLNMDTSLLRTVFFVHGKALTLFLSSTCFIRTVDSGQWRLLSCPISRFIKHCLDKTLYYQLCAVIDLSFSKVKKDLHLTACECFQHYSRPDRVNCRRQFQTIMVWNESYRECFWLSSIRMSDFLVFLWNKSMEGRLCDG